MKIVEHLAQQSKHCRYLTQNVCEDGMVIVCRVNRKGSCQTIGVKHCCEQLGGNIIQFVMNVTDMFQNDTMLRQVTESVMIDKVEDHQHEK